VKEPADENKCVGWAKLEKLFWEALSPKSQETFTTFRILGILKWGYKSW
jgi:hypothetical protein